LNNGFRKYNILSRFLRHRGKKGSKSTKISKKITYYCSKCWWTENKTAKCLCFISSSSLCFSSTYPSSFMLSTKTVCICTSGSNPWTTLTHRILTLTLVGERKANAGLHVANVQVEDNWW